METGKGGDMTPQKRAMDLVLVAVIGLFALIPFCVVVIIMTMQKGSVFYVSERMKTPTQGFQLWKFRTMQPTLNDTGVSGGEKSNRITGMGQFLRKTRFDEIPQLWNVLIGDMSIVGPRPPLRQYTDAFPDIYTKVLAARPGITGLATLVYHRRETEILAECKSPEETDAAYRRHCIPAKARLDRMYLRHRSLCLDLKILGRTIIKVLG